MGRFGWRDNKLTAKNLNVELDIQRSSQTLTAGATVAINAKNGRVATLTPAENETITISNVGAVGDTFTLKILTSGTTAYTLTFSTGFNITGTLATGTTTAKIFVIRFVSDGTNYMESSRTTAM